MNRTGDKGVSLARVHSATAMRAAFGLSLVAVVAGLALSFVSLSGVLLVAIGAAWYSWLDYRRRPDDERIREIMDRLESMQAKLNTIQLKVLG